MPERLAAFFALPRRERRLLVSLSLAIVLARWRLRREGFGALRARRPPESPDPVPTEAHEVARLLRLARIAARHAGGRSPCLPACLVVAHALSRLGVATDLRFGVVREGALLHAHAWLEREGEPLFDIAPDTAWHPLGTASALP